MDAYHTHREAVLFSPVLAIVSLLCGALLTAGEVAAAGSVEAGQTKAIICAACHGVDGNSLNPEWPSLAGQHETYIIKQLQAFKRPPGQNGARQNVLMSGQALALADQDMADLAAYFSQQKRAGRTADPALVTSGERLYRGGNRDTGVPACLACHGPTGEGNLPAGWPSIAGQHAPYTAAQLTAYRGKQRTTDGDTQIMRNVAAALTDEEIRSVASYVQGLR